jgi:hypothetical protein
LERAQAWAPLDVVFTVAEGWADVRPQDAVFWRDRGFGRRLCALIDGQIDRLREAGPDITARARRLVERLIAAGVPEALPLEQQRVTIPE